MDQKSPTEHQSTSTSHPTQPETFDKELSKIPLSILTEAYPHDVILHYIIVPTTLCVWWVLLGVFLSLFIHYRVCVDYSNSELVCSKRTHFLLFAVEVALMGLLGYTYYLKLKLMRTWSIARERAAALEKE